MRNNRTWRGGKTACTLPKRLNHKPFHSNGDSQSLFIRLDRDAARPTCAYGWGHHRTTRSHVLYYLPLPVVEPAGVLGFGRKDTLVVTLASALDRTNKFVVVERCEALRAMVYSTSAALKKDSAWEIVKLSRASSKEGARGESPTASEFMSVSMMSEEQ